MTQIIGNIINKNILLTPYILGLELEGKSLKPIKQNTSNLFSIVHLLDTVHKK